MAKITIKREENNAAGAAVFTVSEGDREHRFGVTDLAVHFRIHPEDVGVDTPGNPPQAGTIRFNNVHCFGGGGLVHINVGHTVEIDTEYMLGYVKTETAPAPAPAKPAPKGGMSEAAKTKIVAVTNGESPKGEVCFLITKNGVIRADLPGDGKAAFVDTDENGLRTARVETEAIGDDGSVRILAHAMDKQFAAQADVEVGPEQLAVVNFRHGTITVL